MTRFAFSFLLVGVASAAVSGQSVEDVREFQLIALGSWMDSNPDVAVCVTGLAKPSSWKTPVARDAEIPGPSRSELDAIEAQLAARHPTRVVPYCIPVRDGIATDALDELLRRVERREECTAFRSLVIEAETRGASPQELNELFRAGSTASCYPSTRSLMGPYGGRAARLAISTPIFMSHGPAMVLMSPSFRTSRNDYLFCLFERAEDAWAPTPECERLTYTH